MSLVYSDLHHRTLAPVSPWFLIRKGRFDDAERVIRRVASKGSNDNPAEIVTYMVRADELELTRDVPGIAHTPHLTMDSVYPRSAFSAI
ncbi:hypothetical protein CcaverHIS631_0103860 [Cutaneotrichosporon cavernicola]|nr:hypothetical protein CcaverHIS631_0103860 [Cutaneotrichosporon cavernicola]BEJ03211.1 hypothetical protein CcaverHIS641_0103860 [Cutaneotrichosporon cavernicola]